MAAAVTSAMRSPPRVKGVLYVFLKGILVLEETRIVGYLFLILNRSSSENTPTAEIITIALMTKFAVSFFADVHLHAANRINLNQIVFGVFAELRPAAITTKMIAFCLEFMVMLRLFSINRHKTNRILIRVFDGVMGHFVHILAFVPYSMMEALL